MTDTQKDTVSVSRERFAAWAERLELADSGFPGSVPFLPELRAILAQPAEQQDEPVYQVCDGVNGWIDVDRLRYTACQLEPEEYECRTLYRRPPAQPVKTEEDRYPPCDYCDLIPDYHPWHGSGMLNGVENKHIQACNACRAQLPSHFAAQAVKLPEEHGDRCDSREAEAYQNGFNDAPDAVAKLNGIEP